MNDTSISKETIHLTTLDSPIGKMIACATREGICLLEFADRRMLPTEFKDLKRLLEADIIESHSSHFDKLQQQLHEYFEGTRKEFDIPLIMPGTLFQKKVWKSLQAIPYGTTRSYKEQSVSIAKLDAIRAVASANGHNRIAIIIPCHRVIGENGHLTGYGGGLWRKKWLLDHERSGQIQTSLEF